MPVTFVSAGTSDAQLGAASPGLPAGFAADDILILVIEGEGQDANPDGQGDFGGTLVGSVASAEDDVGGRTRNSTYWKRATGAEVSVTTDDAGDHTGAIITAFRGVITSGDPIDGTPVSTIDATADVNNVANGCTTLVNNSMVIYAGTFGNDWSSSGQAGTNLVTVTKAFDWNHAVGSDGYSVLYYGIMAAAGATGTLTDTAAGTVNEAWWCFGLLEATNGVPTNLSMGGIIVNP